MSDIVATREQEARSLILERQKQIGSLLSDPQKSKKFSAVLLSASMDYALSKCSTKSIIEAGIGAAMLQLSPDKNLGQAYLVPYETKSGGFVCQLQIGYRGYNALLERIGWHIKTHVVYACDDAAYEIDGWEERFMFRPNYAERQSDPAWIYNNFEKVVTIAKAPDGELFYQILTKKEIEKIRMKSQNQKDPNRPSYIWAEWYEEMATKTAIKRHIKRLPIGDEVARSVAIDDLAAAGKVIDYSKTAEEGVIIEARQQEALPQAKAPVNANALLLGNRAQPQRSTANEEKLYTSLIYFSVPKDKIKTFIDNNRDSIDEIVADEKLIEDIAAQLNAGDDNDA